MFPGFSLMYGSGLFCDLKEHADGNSFEGLGPDSPG